MPVILPVICSKPIQRAVQLHNICSKQYIISCSKLKTIKWVYDRQGTEKRASQDTKGDNNVLSRIKQIQSCCVLPFRSLRKEKSDYFYFVLVLRMYVSMQCCLTLLCRNVQHESVYSQMCYFVCLVLYKEDIQSIKKKQSHQDFISNSH